MRQLAALSKKINASKIDHYEFLAKLQGHKLETNLETEQGSILSIEQEKKAEQYLKRLNEQYRGEIGTK